MTVNGASATQSLADYSTNLQFDEIPLEAVAMAKYCLLDTLGCIIGGTCLETGRIILEQAIEQGGAPQASIPGYPVKVPAAVAAQTNANLANVLDFDDTLAGACHPGSPVVASALAVAERYEAKGKSLIAAIVAGYEVTLRLGEALSPSDARRNTVKGLATYQAIGAAAAASRAGRLSVTESVEVLGAAGASAPVPFVRKWGYRERPVSWVKNNYGASAYAAVTAENMVRRGFRASRSILDGPTGFWVMAGSDQWNPLRLLDIDKAAPAILGTTFKPYPCCRFLHSAIDAAIQIRQQPQFDAGSVRTIDVQVFSDYLGQNFMVPLPTTAIDAQFSLPHAVAVALYGNPRDPSWFRAPLMSDPTIRGLATRVAIQPNTATISSDSGHSMWSRVTVTLDSGAVIESMVAAPKGEPDNPLTFTELSDKFVLLTEARLGTERAQSAIDAICQLETFRSLDPLMTIIRGGDRMNA